MASIYSSRIPSGGDFVPSSPVEVRDRSNYDNTYSDLVNVSGSGHLHMLQWDAINGAGTCRVTVDGKTPDVLEERSKARAPDGYQLFTGPLRFSESLRIEFSSGLIAGRDIFARVLYSLDQ